MKVINVILFLSLSMTCIGQDWEIDQLKKLSKKYRWNAITEFRDMLSIPNDAHYNSHVKANVDWFRDAFSKRGFKVDILQTDGPTVLLGTFDYGKKSTTLIYMHADGQAVDSSKWDQESPYIPVLKYSDGEIWRETKWPKNDKKWDDEHRIFARSVSDAKGPIAMFLAVIDIINKEEFTPDFNLKVVIDFEEEIGSPNLPGAVTKYQNELKADRLVILDGPLHPTNKPTLLFGARGMTTISLEVFGPKFSQHSGHYGNFIPNPAMRLAQLLADMKDDEGRVSIKGFYDDIIIDEKTKSIMAEVPDDEAEIKRKIGVAGNDKVAPSLQEAIQFPSLNIRGLSSGWTGNKARTIIPSSAVAEIDIRLVPESDPERLISLVKSYIRSKGYHIVSESPTDQEREQYDRIVSLNYKNSYEAFRTPIDSPTGNWLNAALARAFDDYPIRIRMAGGSVPISPFVQTLKIPAVIVPTVNPDNNQHSPNENLRLGNFEKGIRTILAVLTEPIN